MDPNFEAPAGFWSALAMIVSGFGGAIVAQIGYTRRQQGRLRRGTEQGAAVSAEHAYSLLVATQDRRIADLRTDIDAVKSELHETRESLEERNEAWMVASRLHEDCERRLKNLESWRANGGGR